jgi:hypothetical protein
MSEKTIRETLEVLYDFYVEEVGFDDHTADAVYSALEDEPDLVKVMRKIVDLVVPTGPDAMYLSNSEAWAMGYIKHWIENEFGVHLTDDSWEYVEEKDDR